MWAEKYRPWQHRASRRLLATAATASLVLIAVATSVAFAAVGPSQSGGGFPSGSVMIDGHGWGPGIGMGQWGAFGYAAVEHEGYGWILHHFYGGTTLSTLPAAKDGAFSVAITSYAGAPLEVTSPSRFSFGGVAVVPGAVARATISATTGLFTIATAASCNASSASWKTVATGLKNPVALPLSQAPAAPLSDLLTLCTPGRPRKTVRGTIKAYDYDDANTADKPLARTVNTLSLEEYVADVVPAESSTGWGDVGGKGPQGEEWGFQELEAQAVAARSYALSYEAAGGWSGYADICDSDQCQSYPGVTDESLLATLATTDTKGEYLTSHGAAGAAVTTSYSASSGGYTAASAFPAVVDAGDSVCLKNTGLWTCNEEHDWFVSVPVTTIEQTFKSIGTLESITATARNGLGQWGGRVVEIKITGTTGELSESGDTFESQFDLLSNWFVITHPAPPTTTTSTTTTTTTATTATTSTTTTTTLPARVDQALSTRRGVASRAGGGPPPGTGPATGPVPQSH